MPAAVGALEQDQMLDCTNSGPATDISSRRCVSYMPVIVEASRLLHPGGQTP